MRIAYSRIDGLDEYTSTSSRAFELYSKEKTFVLDVTTKLNIVANKSIGLHHSSYNGCSER
jgi:hypothetical protein